MRKNPVILLALLLISGACSKDPEPHVPVIGISCSRSDTGKDELLPAYSSAFTRAGATVFIIPTIATEQEARNIIASLDGILISGGVSVNPAWYGEEILNETVWVDPVRDLSDSLLVRSALASGMPILAICRGSQLLNVMQGGSLYQDIPVQLPDAMKHSGGVKHKIGIKSGSVLERLFGPDSLMVNSYHHQSIKTVAPGFTVTARASDGIIEAYEAPLVWGFQFHPERLVKEDDTWLKLFKAYLSILPGTQTF